MKKKKQTQAEKKFAEQIINFYLKLKKKKLQLIFNAVEKSRACARNVYGLTEFLNFAVSHYKEQKTSGILHWHVWLGFCQFITLKIKLVSYIKN